MNGGALRASVTGAFTNNLVFADNTASTVAAAASRTLTFGPDAGTSFVTFGDGSTATFGSATDTGTIVIASDFNNINTNAQVVVAGGTLRDGSGWLGNALGSMHSTTVDLGATLDLNDQAPAVHNLLGAGNVIIGTSAASTLFLLSGNDDGTFASHLFSGVISGPGGVEVGPVGTGGGTTILAGSNTYGGNTTIQDTTTLQLGNGGSNGSILGNITFAAPGVNGPTAGSLVFNRSDTYVFAGTISGPGNVVQSGTGTTILNGNSTFAGGTTVAHGTLGGNGTIGAVTVQTGATLAPGASAGTFHTGSVTFNAGATFAVELGGTGAGQFDQLAVTGTVSLGGATLSASFINGFNASGTFTIIDNDGTGDAVTGQFAQGTGFSVGGVTYAINYAGGDGNDVVLTVTAPLSTTPTPGNDSLTGTDGPDTIAALESDDIVLGLGAGATSCSATRATTVSWRATAPTWCSAAWATTRSSPAPATTPSSATKATTPWRAAPAPTAWCSPPAPAPTRSTASASPKATASTCRARPSRSPPRPTATWC